MANVFFHHPLIPTDLAISTNPDQITWAYGLNTAVFPTYGGEVVQILSVYFDDMSISGTVSTYGELERIYSWFIAYMQYATQGVDNPSYDQHPVHFRYPERDWHFKIWPKSLPGFTYGRDVVAPTWSLLAAVKEPAASVADYIKSYATFQAANKGTVDEFGTATADFGTTGDLTTNPWASVDGSVGKNQTINQYITQAATKLADEFSGFIGDYTPGSLGNLPMFPDISKAAPPTSSATKGGNQAGTTSKPGKKVGK